MNRLPDWVIWITIAALLLLMVWFAGYAQELPTIPKAAPQPVKLYYFAATATNESGVSDYSDEISTEIASPMLAWDGSTNATGYLIHRGRESGTYTNHWSAGSNTQFQVPSPALKTNRVITITSVNATNLLYSTRLTGPWYLTGFTNKNLTNPPVGLFYRALSAKKNPRAHLFIVEHVQ